MNSIGKIAKASSSTGQVGLVRNLERYFADAERDIEVERLTTEASGQQPASYWRQDGEIGRWRGNGAKALGLDGSIERAAFRSVFEGLDPATGQPLGRQWGKARWAAFDVAFSAPKSVSLLYALSDDERVRQAVLDALRAGAEASAQYLEEHAAYARRYDPVSRRAVVCKAELVQAQFLHRISRPVTDPTTGEVTVDPQLHVHTVIPALVRRVDDGQLSALYSQPLYSHAAAAGTLGQAVMRDQLVRELGVEVEVASNGTFELRGVDAALRGEFARRTQQIERASDAMDVTSRMGRKVATLATRESKDEITKLTAGAWSRVRERAAALGWTPERIRGLLGRERRAQEERTMDTNPERLLAELTKENFLLRRRDVVRALAVHAPRGASAEQLEEMADRILADPGLAVPLRPSEPQPGADGLLPAGLAMARWEETGQEQRYTTPEVLELEGRMLRSALERQEAQVAQASPEHVAAAVARWEAQHGLSLTAGQTRMVDAICRSHASVIVVEGRAGAGKTAAAEVAREALNASGVYVVGGSLAGRAALQLEEDSGIPSYTLAALIPALEEAAPPRGSAIVIDEAGMAGSRDVARLVELAARHEAKLVLIGDRAQLQPMDGGAAFRALGDRLGTVDVPEVLRQREEWQREAAAALRQERGLEAWESFRQHDAVRVLPGADERRQAMVADYTAATQSGHDTVMLTLRRDEVADLNQLARGAADLEGRLGEQAATVAGREYRIGDQLICLQNAGRIRNGTRGELVAIEGDILQLRTATGEEMTIDSSWYQSLDYGYAMTLHKAQGLTADQVLFAGSESAWAELTYTAITRQREGVTFYAVDRAPESDPAGVHHAPLEQRLERPSWEDRYARGWVSWERKESTLDYEVGFDGKARPVTAPEPAQRPSSAERRLAWLRRAAPRQPSPGESQPAPEVERGPERE